MTTTTEKAQQLYEAAGYVRGIAEAADYGNYDEAEELLTVNAARIAEIVGSHFVAMFIGQTLATRWRISDHAAMRTEIVYTLRRLARSFSADAEVQV